MGYRMTKPTIVNLVATANLEQPVDLMKLHSMQHVTYDQELYGGRVAYLKTPNMHGKVSIFFTGKLISIGTTSSKQAEEDLSTTAQLLVERRLIKPVVVKANTRNIVALLQFQGPSLWMNQQQTSMQSTNQSNSQERFSNEMSPRRPILSSIQEK